MSIPIYDSAEFYLRRERQERGLAHECPDGITQKLHLQIADRYAVLASKQLNDNSGRFRADRQLPGTCLDLTQARDDEDREADLIVNDAERGAKRASDLGA